MVYVGDPFEVAVKTVLEANSPTFKSYVQADIVPAASLAFDPSNPNSISDLMTQLSQGGIKPLN